MRIGNDKITDHEDWKDGINVFRSRVIEQLDGILEVLDIFEKDITIIKQKIKGEPQ